MRNVRRDFQPTCNAGTNFEALALKNQFSERDFLRAVESIIVFVLSQNISFQTHREPLHNVLKLAMAVRDVKVTPRILEFEATNWSLHPVSHSTQWKRVSDIVPKIFSDLINIRDMHELSL